MNTANIIGMKIEFYLQYHTRFGQRLSIVGNIPELGKEQNEKALLMTFMNEQYWYAAIEVNPKEHDNIHYHYLMTNEVGETEEDGEKDRYLHISKSDADILIVRDTWNFGGNYGNAFYTAPFEEVFFKNKKQSKAKKVSSFTHTFKVKAPLLAEDEIVCLSGSVDELANWNTEKPVLMEKHDDWWIAKVDLSKAEFPLTYKYGLYNNKKELFARFEDGDNRLLSLEKGKHKEVIIHDGFIHLPNTTWHGAGVAIPVFSLRSNDSFGVGEFTDIKLLVDWANETGLRLIQLLPVNDTTATFTWKDSYPYAAISAFALHPLYINLSKVAGKKQRSIVQALAKKQEQLNALSEVDYEQVMKHKTEVLKELYQQQHNDFLEDEDYKDFFKANQHWLVPYAAFSYLRDKYGTSEFHKWKTNSEYDVKAIDKLTSHKSKQFKQIAFYYFVQYHLHIQLKEVVSYAHKRNVVLKGDIPIGIYRYGCDAWTAPQLYNMDLQAGAPPDDFAVKGQNWGFPTYNWQQMQQNHFEWWRQRFHQMSYYFDAFRIDHILGFFRIWSIPVDAVEGIMGVFVPALPVHINEFGERGIWFDYDRFCKPYITDAVLMELFGDKAEHIKETFLQPDDKGGYELQFNFNTQRKVENYFAYREISAENQQLKQGLYDLISNVLLFEEVHSFGQKFHFRIAMDTTTSFNYLDDATKHQLKELYIDYFYHRQDEFWKKEALIKLPALKNATNMLICGEDLGMVPHSVPEVMKLLGILSLEIQRMPKNPQTEFFHPKDAPYLSVVTPSTHDMSTIRGWWEENRSRTQRFYNTILEAPGTAPYFCEPWVNCAIILQHLYSPAMWSIFQLQDLLGMSEVLRRNIPQEERINDPANPNHYWNYRMHLTLEQLIEEKAFNNELKDYITNSGRG